MQLRKHGHVRAVAGIKAYVHEKPQTCTLTAVESVVFGKSVGSAECAVRARIHESQQLGPLACQSVMNKFRRQALEALVMSEQLKKQKQLQWNRRHRQP